MSQSTNVEDPDLDDELTQLNVRTTRASIRAFKRLADRQDKTLSQWVLDELWGAVGRDLGELRKSIEEAEAKAQREIKADTALLASIERDNEKRARENASQSPSKTRRVRQNVPT